MKTLKLVTAIMVVFLAGTTQAQVSVNVNVGAPPLWGPVGYTEVQYYYLPDVEAYYDVPNSKFIYYEGSTWVHRTYLPRRYRSYDLYGGYKVVMSDYHGHTPYIHYKEHKSKYAKGYRGKEQRSIGERPVHKNTGARVSQHNKQEHKSIRSNVKSGNHKNDRNMNNDRGRSNGHGKKK